MLVSKKLKLNKRIFLLVLVPLPLIGFALFAQGKSIKITLVDSISNEPIANESVEFYSDNGTRCITSEGCDTNGKTYRGTTNQSGAVYISKTLFQESNHINSQNGCGASIPKPSPFEKSVTVTLQVKQYGVCPLKDSSPGVKHEPDTKIIPGLF